MKRFLTILIGMTTLACNADPRVGARFELQRDLRDLSAREEEMDARSNVVETPEWQALANDYVALANRGLEIVAKGDTAIVARHIEYASARALMRAASITSEHLGNPMRVDEMYDRLAQRFEDAPEIAAAVSFEQAKRAERNDQLLDAASHYQAVVDRIEPRVDEKAGTLAKQVLQLPLHIARLYRQYLPEDEAGKTTYYQQAVDYYRRYTTPDTEPALRIRAQHYLASIAWDDGNWSYAADLLDSLDTWLGRMESPPLDRGEIRLNRAEALHQAGAPSESIEKLLTSIAQECSTSAFVASSEIALVDHELEDGRPSDAIVRLNDIEKRYRNDIRTASQALLRKANITWDQGNHRQARDIYRELQLEYPLSDAALQAPLELIEREAATNDVAATRDALQRAETAYRSFITQYPVNEFTIVARENLIKVLQGAQKDSLVVVELLNLGEAARGSREGMTAMQRAAELAFVRGDLQTMHSILAGIQKTYPGTRFAEWAAETARQHREDNQP